MPFVPDKPSTGRFVPDADQGQAKSVQQFQPSGLVPELTIPEKIMGFPGTQFAIGAAEPVLGAAQAAHGAMENVPEQFRPLVRATIPGMSAMETLGSAIDAKAIQEMSEKGAQLYGGNWTRVPARLAGNILSPAFLAIAKALPAAATLGDLVKAGMATGGIAGATTLQPEGNDLGQRAINTGIGMAVGGAIPLGIEAGKGVGRGLRNLWDLTRGEKGAANILDRYIQRSVGPENVPSVAAQLRKGGVEPIPGYKPTAAEAVAGLPEGSPLIAHQRITAATPGGPSAEFGRRISTQKEAIAAATQARDNAVVPMLNQSLRVANQTGIKSDDVLTQIDDMLQTPGFRASDVVNKSLTAVKEKIAGLAKDGIVEGQDLWTVRKEIGNTIKTYAKETGNWDKRLTAGLERQVQKSIDAAIVKAGATDWPHHMAEYALQSQRIQAVKDTAKAAIRPEQRTDLFGGLRIAEETRTHVPQMLSRPMMLANAVLRKLSSDVEPNIDKIATRYYLNPQEFAKALEQMTPRARSQVMSELQTLGVAGAVIGSERAAQQ